MANTVDIQELQEIAVRNKKYPEEHLASLLDGALEFIVPIFKPASTRFLIRLPIFEMRRILQKQPYLAVVHITNRCNGNCLHCVYKVGLREARREPTIDEWEAFFLKLYRQGIRAVNLWGGEPTLRMDVLKLAARIFPLLLTITNGTNRIGEWFKGRIFLSIDGPPEVNDYLRGKGAFEQAIRHYQGDKRVIINSVVTHETLPTIGEIPDIAKELGVLGVVYNVECFRKGDNTRFLTQEEYREIEEKLLELSELPNVYMSKPLIRKMMHPENRNNHKCYYGSSVSHYQSDFTPRQCYNDYVECGQCRVIPAGAGNPIFAGMRSSKVARMYLP